MHCCHCVSGKAGWRATGWLSLVRAVFAMALSPYHEDNYDGQFEVLVRKAFRSTLLYSHMVLFLSAKRCLFLFLGVLAPFFFLVCSRSIVSLAPPKPWNLN
jgi:hypothetical protein